MHIIAVSTIKGGVGKMTTAVNPACLVAASGRSTVLWDLDPQGTAACVLRGEPREQASARQLVRGKLEIAGLVANTAYVNLGRVPADFSDRNLDLRSSERKHRTERLLRMTRSLPDAVVVPVLPAIAPNSPAADVYAALWREVEENSCRTPH